MYVLKKKRTNLSGVISFKKHFFEKEIMDLRQIKSSSRFFSYVVAQPTQRLKSILKESHLF